MTEIDLESEHAELLPDREVLSLLTDPTAMDMPGLLGPPETADTGAGAGDLAGGTAGDANHLAGSAADGHQSDGGGLTEMPRDETYSSSETATAG